MTSFENPELCEKLWSMVWLHCFIQCGYICTVGSRFATVRFTTLVESDRALPTCASLSQLKRPSFTQCASSSFPVCMCFFLFYFNAVLLSWLWFFQPWHPSKRQKIRKNQTVDVTVFLDVLWTTAWAFFNKIKSDLIDIFSIISVIFYIPDSLN